MPQDGADLNNMSKITNDNSDYLNVDNVQDVSMIPIDYQISSNTQDMQHFKMPHLKSMPVNIFSSPDLEELAFPHLYPFGTHGRPKQPTIHQPPSQRVCRG